MRNTPTNTPCPPLAEATCYATACENCNMEPANDSAKTAAGINGESDLLSRSAPGESVLTTGLSSLPRENPNLK